MSVEGHQAKDGEDMQAFMNALSPAISRRWRFRFSRAATSRPADAKEDAKVAIVNRKFAQHFFKGESAIGKRIGRGGGPNTKLDIEIIGVVADSLYEGPREGVRRQVFMPNWGNSASRSTSARDRRRRRLQPDPQRGEAARRVDAGLRHEDARRGSSTKRCSPIA